MASIYLGSDYNGFKKKTAIFSFLQKNYNNTFEIIDNGTFSENQNDYNDSAIAVSKAVKENPGSFGILICGSAHGMCIQANRFKNIRAINAFSPESAKLGREHDDANILCLSAQLTNLEAMEKIIDEFLKTKFGKEERRVRRIKKLDEVAND